MSCNIFLLLHGFSQYRCMRDNSRADAILDRLMHNAHRLEMKVESMRKRLTQVD
ncbi:ATP-binding protein [Klebsiella variicola]|uniref:ATP-binding protein n=1 Tax=Klebsiella variicola TaxID=244366 RepID=UPI004044BF28